MISLIAQGPVNQKNDVQRLQGPPGCRSDRKCEDLQRREKKPQEQVQTKTENPAVDLPSVSYYSQFCAETRLRVVVGKTRGNTSTDLNTRNIYFSK